MEEEAETPPRRASGKPVVMSPVSCTHWLISPLVVPKIKGTAGPPKGGWLAVVPQKRIKFRLVPLAASELFSHDSRCRRKEVMCDKCAGFFFNFYYYHSYFPLSIIQLLSQFFVTFSQVIISSLLYIFFLSIGIVIKGD